MHVHVEVVVIAVVIAIVRGRRSCRFRGVSASEWCLRDQLAQARWVRKRECPRRPNCHRGFRNEVNGMAADLVGPLHMIRCNDRRHVCRNVSGATRHAYHVSPHLLIKLVFARGFASKQLGRGVARRSPARIALNMFDHRHVRM